MWRTIITLYILFAGVKNSFAPSLGKDREWPCMPMHTITLSGMAVIALTNPGGGKKAEEGQRKTAMD
jgi:hypothetical protein